MQSDKLRAALEELRAEINRADLSEGPTKDRLNGLINDLERKLEDPEDEEHHASLLDNVRDSIGQLETEYPRTTSILNQIAASLGGIGI